MKPPVLSVAVSVLLFAVLPLPAQNAATPAPAPASTAAATPRPQRPPPAPPTKIEADGKVTFWLRAPQAKSVVIKGQWQKGDWQKDALPLTRTESKEGDWTLVVDKVPPGVWEYWFEVDGTNVLDPSNTQVKPQRSPGKSILHIPSTPPAAWDLQDVPHGAVHAHDYLSKSLGKPRQLAVYTPPGYEFSGNKKYPVLVLQHGSGDNQKTWVDHGKMHWILDNLIARKKVVPMVVLMIDGHPLGMRPQIQAIPNEEQKDREAREDAERKAFTASAMNAFERDLFEDALPLLESRYRVEKESARRAFAGLSMGGEQAINVGLMHPEKFGWIGAFSAEIPKGDLPGKIADIAVAAGPALKLLWIQTGKDDKDKLGQNQNFVALLNQKGLKFHWQLTEGDHSWPVWRSYLVDFLPQIFPPEPRPEEGSTVFTLRAPQAKAVVVRGQWSKEPLPLARKDEKDWSLVLEKGKIPPGVWEYSYEVDGMTVIDPNNPSVKPQRQPNTSLLHIPSDPPAPWDWQNVPHGVLNTHEYFSTVLGKPREMVVYTPPGYGTSGKSYPLLVLQHGWGDNQRVWVAEGKMNLILDNLIAQKKVVPMVVLMINGHPLPQDPPAPPGAEMQAFEGELFKDALPIVESSYRVEKDSAQRAFAGLSMGGEQAINVGLMHPEKFGWIGAFSAEIPKGDLPEKIADIAVAAGPSLKLLWIQSGKDDRPKLKQNQDFVALLNRKGLKFHWQLTEGDHSWPIWRGYLVDFLPLIFRDPGT